MADISTYLRKIMEAVYGEEVRGSIYNALVAMNTESTNAMQYASTARDSAQAAATSAEASAQLAGQKAAEAVISEQNAATSEENAAMSEGNAGQRASEAGVYAAGAATSERNAANSEAVATQKAQEAHTSKEAAAQSAAEAEASESTTRTLRGETEVYAANAKADKEAADASKLAAQESESNAATSESNARVSEQNALAASNVAVQMKNAATSAKEAAEEAQDAAETAEANAKAAKETAETAAGDAEESAQDAENSAQTAQRYSGHPPRPDTTTKTWWIWDAESDEYVDSHIGSEIAGPQGISIDDIVLVSGDHTPGSSDIYEVQLSDGSTKRISVWNGRNGEGSGDVLGTGFDLVLPVSGWEDGELTVADERLLALSTYKYIIGADDASRAEFLDCCVQPKDIRTDGVITFTSEYTPTMDLTVSVVRLELAANS